MVRHNLARETSSTHQKAAGLSQPNAQQSPGLLTEQLQTAAPTSPVLRVVPRKAA